MPSSPGDTPAANPKPSLRLAEVAGASDVEVARSLILEYQESLDVDLAFQDFADEVTHLEAHYGPPGGALLLAWADDAPAGCVGVRRLTEHVCEMKRLYVRPAVRGYGLGRALAEAIIDRARGIGYTRMRLDTLPTMSSAQALYVSLGFYEVAPYRPNPVANTRFLEKAL